MPNCSARFFPAGFRKRLVHLLGQSWPIALTQLNWIFFSFVSLPFVGRLDQTQMAAFGLATTTTNVFGTGILIGIFTASETLLSQAFGEKNFKKVSVFCQQSVWIGLVAVAPMIAVILNASELFTLLGQTEDVIRDAESYILIYLPVFPISVVYMTLMKFLNCQFIVVPCAVAGLIANAANVLWNYVFIEVLSLGLRGAAISVNLTSLLFTLMLIAYILCRRLHRDVWEGFSVQALLSWKPFLRLALPGIVMISLQFWAFEIGMICCALLSEEDLSTHLIVIQIISYCFNMYQGFSIATCIGVGNALGAGSADLAKTIANVSLTIATSLGSALTLFFLAAHSVVPRFFTDIPEILALARKVMPLVAAFQLADSVATIANGVIRGCGRQKLGAIINLVGYYVLSLPIGVTLTFPFGAGWGVVGFWSAQLLAQFFLAFLLLLFQFRFIKWEKEVQDAMERISPKTLSPPSTTTMKTVTTYEQYGAMEKEIERENEREEDEREERTESVTVERVPEVTDDAKTEEAEEKEEEEEVDIRNITSATFCLSPSKSISKVPPPIRTKDASAAPSSADTDKLSTDKKTKAQREKDERSGGRDPLSALTDQIGATEKRNDNEMKKSNEKVWLRLTLIACFVVAFLGAGITLRVFLRSV